MAHAASSVHRNPSPAGVDAPERGRNDGAPVRDEFLVFGEPLVLDDEIDEVVATMRSGWLGTGPKVREFERRFASYVGASNAVAVNSGTAALHLALDLLGIGPGDEVITTPLTFAATANVIEHVRARPVFADVDRVTMNIDPNAIGRRLSVDTKAIIPVHLTGRPCPMDEIRAMTDRLPVALISDAAHAIETRYRGERSGTLGDLVAYSFYVTKNLTTVEGGMIVTEHADWAEEMRIRSLHGLDRDAWKRYSADGFKSYETVYPGYKYNLTDFQASIGLRQLERLDEMHRIRDRHARFYADAFADVPGLFVPPDSVAPGDRQGRHLFVVLLDLSRLTITRDEFVALLKAENVGAGVHFTPLHLHKYYREKYGYRPGDFPNAEWVGERTVSLPLSAKLSDHDCQDVAAAVIKLVRAHRRAGVRR